MTKPLEERRCLIDKGSDLSIDTQCELISIHKSGLYYRPVAEREENLAILRFLDEQYFKTPFYGTR